MPAMEKMPAKMKRNVKIAESSLALKTYREIAEEHNISPATVSRVLNRKEIKQIVEHGMVEMISRVPKGIKVVDQALDDYENNPGISLKAADYVLKTATIAPSNVENQTINNIVNVQNNITLSPGVAKAMTGMFNHDDEDIIDGEVIDR